MYFRIILIIFSFNFFYDAGCGPVSGSVFKDRKTIANELKKELKECGTFDNPCNFEAEETTQTLKKIITEQKSGEKNITKAISLPLSSEEVEKNFENIENNFDEQEIIPEKIEKDENNSDVANMVKQMLDYLSTKGLLLVTESNHNHQNQILVAPSEYEYEDMSSTPETEQKNANVQSNFEDFKE